MLRKNNIRKNNSGYDVNTIFLKHWIKFVLVGFILFWITGLNFSAIIMIIKKIFIWFMILLLACYSSLFDGCLAEDGNTIFYVGGSGGNKFSNIHFHNSISIDMKPTI